MDKSSLVHAQTANEVTKSEKQRFEMFVQLVTQCFHLAIRLKQDRVGGVRRLDSARNDRQAADRADRFQQKRIDDTYIRVLAQVFDGMRREQSFLPGLKVFVQAV